MLFSSALYFSILSLAKLAVSKPVATVAAASGAAQTIPAGAAAPEVRDGQTGRLIVYPPRPTDTSTKRIPDAAHPYVAPGKDDMRGPCPALNTLANHGYIPHNGVATPEQILTAVMEAFNMDHDFGGFVVSFATMARGNPFIGKLSIGGQTPLVPPLPGMIDGPVAGGIAKHGRFEGDVSMTRKDVHIGDNVNFQQDLFDRFLFYIGKYGDDGPEGPSTVVNVKVMQEFKFEDYQRDIADDPQFEFRVGRALTAFSEVAFVLDLFANGTDGRLSTSGLSSIFRNQTFAPNWFRRSSPATLEVLSTTSGQVMSAHPFLPGASVNGKFTPDTVSNFLCEGYGDLASNQLAHTLNNATGILAKNIATLTAAMVKPFADLANCPMLKPSGPVGA